MTARAIDERAFHRWLVRTLGRRPTGLLPLGDDVAALPVGGRTVALLTTDALSEGTHFLPDSDPAAVGRAVAAVSLSDLASKGGRPVAGLLDLLVPRGTPARWAEDVARGMDAMGRRFGAPLVGGDTKLARGRSVVGTYLGLARPDHLPARRAARPGDRLVVTGRVGRGGVAAAALAAGRHDRRTLRELLEVEPRVREGALLARWAHAMVDTSDGLAESTRLLAAASRCRIEVDEGSIPWVDGLTGPGMGADRRRRVGLYGGDYELLAALPDRAIPGARRAVERKGVPLTEIGRVLLGRGSYLRTADGGRRPMPGAGWDPFHLTPP